MWFIRFKQISLFFVLPWIVSLCIQSVGRLYLLYSYVDAEQITAYHHDVMNLIFIGFCFDLRISCILFGTLFILAFAALFSERWFNRVFSYLIVLLPVVLIFILLFTLINVFYFVTYSRHIDVFIFGLIDDDTIAIIKTIWSDYPVIRGMIVLMVLSYFFCKLCQMWRVFILKHVKQSQPMWFGVSTVFAVLLFVCVGARGSVGVFPLRQSDGQISSYSILNQFVPNGLIAFDWAYKGYRTNSQFNTISEKDRKRAMMAFFGKKKANSVSIFMNRVAKNPFVDKNPPHVVLSIMESMGSHFFLFDNSGRDLLGSLRRHWQHDWIFSRFISEGDGTIDSLNRFFVRSSVDKISQSSAQNGDFVSNMFIPFRKKGYKIIYITAGNGSWRNLNQFLPHLGVDEFIEQNTLIREFPEAKLGTWGIDDEYMFKYAEKRLVQAEKDGEHVMIMMMSVSNHPPYRIPASHRYINYTFSPAELERLKNLGSETEIRDIFNTFRYSNQQLGDFIDWIKSTNLQSHTIIAATGDHNLRGIGYSSQKELALSHAVPFYLYVPDEYRTNTFYDKTRIGSHKDILPTLYALSLSDTAYYQTGCNLVAEKLDKTWCNVGYNPHVIIDKHGAYSLIDNYFLPWQATTGLLLKESTREMSPDKKQILLRMQSFTTLLYWQISKQILDNEKVFGRK